MLGRRWMKIVMPMVVSGVVVCLGAVASAGIIAPAKVSARVHTAKHPAYTYTTTGRITYPPKYCLPGTSNPVYCADLIAAGVCKGRVSLTIKLGRDPLLAASRKRIKRTTARVKSNCTYSIKTRLPTKVLTAKQHYAAHARGASVRVSFAVKFLGNMVLKPKRARTRTVKAKVENP